MKWIASAVLALLLMQSAGAQILTTTLLGTGTPRPDAQRYGSAVLVETPQGHRLLFDAGRGAVLRMQQLQLPIEKLDQVFITHLHFDHVVGLDDVWLVARLWQRKDPLQVLGPNGTQALAENLKRAYLRDREVRYQQSGLPLETGDLIGEDIGPGIVYAQGDLRVTAFEVDHDHVKPAFGYRVDYGQHSVVISGDTTYSDNLLRHAQDADVLIHEVAMASEKILAHNPRVQKVMASHSTPEQVSQVLSETQPRLALLTHLLLYGVSEEQVLQAVRNTYPGDVRLGQDLMAVDIGESIYVYQRR